MIGKAVSHYRIIEKLGQGGMGEVWRARDARLDREVALKVLPAEDQADETARARLVREARLASKLNHPHICTIYDVGEADGQTYISMELVEGQPLSDRLAGGPLPVDQVLHYGRQLADALSHAHGRGVLHRDLKSANVVVTPEDQVKVLDFGLAKRMTQEDVAASTMSAQTMTEPGVLAGTLAYMAPEQLRGRPADARSDIWALGVVLYEMASGQRPFQGQTGFELTASILNQPVPPAPERVPRPVAEVVERCLAKEPEARYQRGSEVKAALDALAMGGEVARWPTWRASAWGRRRSLGVLLAAITLVALAATLVVRDVGGLRSRFAGRPAAPASAITLAVMPFANLSGDASQDYLGDGITEELITQLGALRPEMLSVIGRTSVMRFKKRDTPIDRIGRELNADYILEGSAKREAARVRITAKLIRVSDQKQVWAQPYEHELSAIMMIQSELAKSVAQALALTLLPAERDRLASARTVNPEAHEAYLRGSSLWKTLKRDDLDAAQRYFDLALVKDPSFAPAYEGLAWVWLARRQVSIARTSEACPKAQAAALQAVTLDGLSASAHEALAAFRGGCEWDWVGAESEWQRSLELNSNSANANAYYAIFLAHRGSADKGLRHVDLALKLDPFNSLYHCIRAQVLIYLRRYDDAQVANETSSTLQPGFCSSVNQWIHILKGMRNEQLADQRLRVARDPERLEAFERGLAEAGYEGAQRRVADVLAARFGKSYFEAVALAMRYLDGGDKDRAIDFLHKAYEIRDPWLVYIGIPLWDPLRSDPRFQALLRRIGLPRQP